MKKIICFILASLIVLSFASCSASRTESPTETEPSSTESPTVETEIVETEITEETVQETSTFDLEAYKVSTIGFLTLIELNKMYLTNLGEYEVNYLTSLKRISGRSSDPETCAYAYEWLEKNNYGKRETIEQTHEQIQTSYRDLILTDIEGKQAQEMDRCIRDLYRGYMDLYDVVNSDSIELDDLSEAFKSAKKAMDDAKEELTVLMK